MIKITKGGGSRAIAALVLLILIFNSLAMLASAAQDQVISVSKDRFLSDTLYVSEGSATLDDIGAAVISFSGTAHTVAMNVSVDYISETDNSLRIVIDNASLCENLTVEYMYRDAQNVLVTRSTEVSIVKGNGAKEYIVPIENASDLASLKLVFNGAAGGTVTLISIGTVSYHDDTRTYCGAITRSEYDPATKTATIAGSVSWESVSQNLGAKIVVYELAQDQTARDISDPESYISWRDISLNYNISLDIKKTVDAYSQYFVAILTRDGKILPIAPEFYLNVKKKTATSDTEVGFKGMEGTMYGGAIEGGSSVAYVDVYLNRLFSYDENGFQYIFDGSEYYVDKDYVTEIDDMMSAYATHDVDVYIRLLVDENGYGELFWEKDFSGRADNYLIDIYDENIFSQFIVYTEYIVSRYSGDSIGSLKGVVLGRSTDLSEQYGYSGEILSLNEYARRTAKLCAALRNILDKYGSGRELVLPLSDSKFGVYRTVHSSSYGGSYPVDILASAVLKYLEDYRSSAESFYLMLESDTAPMADKLQNSPSYDSAGGSERSAAVTSVYETVENCTAFEALLTRLKEKNPLLPDKFVYCWYASDTSVSNNYAYNYNISASFASVRSFVVSFTDLGENASAVLADLKTTYKFADTDKNSEVSREALDKLGFKEWVELVDRFSAENVVKRKLIQQELKNSIPNVISGSYKMWDFEALENASGWQSVCGCDEISIHTATKTTPRSLKLEFSSKDGESYGAAYGSAIYSKENLLKVSGISGISFDILIPKSSQEQIFEILITVESASEIIEFSGVAFSGSEATLYADIENIDTVKSIKISTRELSSSDVVEHTMLLKNMSIHSDEYSDADLEKMVLSGSLEDGIVKNNIGSDALAQFVVLLIVAVSLVLVWGIWIICKITKKI